MLRHFDHVTVAVTDVDAAIGFFGLLGFEKDKDVVISGPTMDRYMGVDGLEARHITLALKDAVPRCEVQLLHFRRPPVARAGDIARLDRIRQHHRPGKNIQRITSGTIDAERRMTCRLQ